MSSFMHQSFLTDIPACIDALGIAAIYLKVVYEMIFDFLGKVQPDMATTILVQLSIVQKGKNKETPILILYY